MDGDELRERNARVGNTSAVVRVIANRRGVDLAAVTGTGPAGQITHADVQAASRGRPLAAARPSSGRFGQPRPEDVSSWAQGSDGQQRLAAARLRGGEPTLFGTGALPPFTRSGIPPEALLEVPWQARHPLAQAATAAEAYRIVEVFTLAPDSAEQLAEEQYGRHPANRDYVARVDRWLLNGSSEAEELARLSAASVARVTQEFRDLQARRGFTL
jgi:pyruvate/2-oxoglutarate dehydrogenase complex dihydrolipoamide acyltransferase (E2) component